MVPQTLDVLAGRPRLPGQAGQVVSHLGVEQVNREQRIEGLRILLGRFSLQMVYPGQVGFDSLRVRGVPVSRELRTGFEVGRHVGQKPWDVPSPGVSRSAASFALGHGVG